MLIVTRRAGQAVCVGDDVRVVLMDVRGKYVRIGIEAPASVPLYRAEISEAERERYRIGADAEGSDEA